MISPRRLSEYDIRCTTAREVFGDKQDRAYVALNLVQEVFKFGRTCLQIPKPMERSFLQTNIAAPIYKHKSCEP